MKTSELEEKVKQLQQEYPGYEIVCVQHGVFSEPGQITIWDEGFDKHIPQIVLDISDLQDENTKD